jgi:hypothetical protein
VDREQAGLAEWGAGDGDDERGEARGQVSKGGIV